MEYYRESNNESVLGEELDFKYINRAHGTWGLGILVGDLEVGFGDYIKAFEIYIGDHTTSFEEFVIHELLLLADTEAFEYNIETDPLEIMEEIYDNHVRDFDRL